MLTCTYFSHLPYTVLVVHSVTCSQVLMAVLLKLKSAGIWHCVTGWMVSDISNDYGAFIFRGQEVQEECQHDPNLKDTTIIQNLQNNSPSDSVVSWKTWVSSDSVTELNTSRFITSLFVQLNAQLNCSRSVKIYIKMLLHVSIKKTIIRELIVSLC